MLWSALAEPPAPPQNAFFGADATVPFVALGGASSLGGALEGLRGRSVLVATRDQLTAALALVELDGVARRMVLCTPDLPPEQLERIAVTAAADAIVLDAGTARRGTLGLPRHALVRAQLHPGAETRDASEETEWVLLTSGTTGAPKLVLHTLASLAGALPRQPGTARRAVWSTFYDIRRYGGLQIFLRAVLGGSSLVLSSPEESTRGFLGRAGAAAVTHISGTPSHWRKVLMSGVARLIAPSYVRLSGEIADQAILDSLAAAYPGAADRPRLRFDRGGSRIRRRRRPRRIPGEPRRKPWRGRGPKVEDGTLRIRSGRNAARYLGEDSAPLRSPDGYVDTGDLVELRDDRYYFVGRRGGVINVGGQKVHPEEVEAVINARSARAHVTGAGPAQARLPERSSSPTSSSRTSRPPAARRG